VTKPFRIEPDATAELKHSSHWHEDRRDGLGREFLLVVDDSLALISQ